MQIATNDGASLPPLYDRWMRELLDAPLPSEPRATCDACPMCERGGRNRSDHVFDATTKCCTYWPSVPNFLAGAILADDDPAAAEGRARFVAALGAADPAARSISTPLGVDPPAGWQRRYAELGGAFGRLRELRCPYYLEEAGGRCGIWRHRNARCATWYCRHERGAYGVALWKDVDLLLTGIERALARWCLLELALPAEALARACPPPGSAIELDPPERLWGPWHGRELDLYRECARLVAGLDWGAVLRLAGAETALAARLTSDAFATLRSGALPARLALGTWHEASETGDGTVRLSTYNVYDPLDLRAEQVEAMRLRQVGSLAEWRRTLAATTANGGDGDGDALLRTLLDRGVLVPADGSAHPLT